jgi:hypothetical protein
MHMKNGLVLFLLLVAVVGCGKSSPPVEPSRSQAAPAQPPTQPANTDVARPTEGIVTQALETVTAVAESAATEVRDQATALAAEAQQQAQTVITQLTAELDQVSTQTQNQLQEFERMLGQQVASRQGASNAPPAAGDNTNSSVLAHSNAVPTNVVRGLETNATAVVTNAVQETQKALDRLLGPKRTSPQ